MNARQSNKSKIRRASPKDRKRIVESVARLLVEIARQEAGKAAN